MLWDFITAMIVVVGGIGGIAITVAVVLRIFGIDVLKY